MMSPTASKADIIRAALQADPGQNVAALARKVGVRRGYVYQLRAKLVDAGMKVPRPENRAARIRAALAADPFQSVAALARRFGCRAQDVYFQRKRMGLVGRRDQSFVPVPTDEALTQFLADEAEKLGPDVTPGLAARLILIDVMLDGAGA